MSGLQASRIVGGIVPPSLLQRIQAGEVDSASLTPASYRLAGNETIRDAAARAWTYLRGAWSAWRDLNNPGAGATRDKWLLPLLRELGYGNVPALSHGLLIDDTSYPISHAWEHVPIHLLAPSVSLDRRNPGVAGAARAPQAMLQEALNREDANLWAILSNGSKLRLLRDSTALAGSAYLEFDLDAIFEGDLYSEFLLLFLLAHSTRLEKRGGSDAGPADCWLEAWRTDAVDTGTRALDRLRAGVEHALVDLGDGFLHQSDNAWLVDALRSGEISDRDYLRALLRLVYRLLFVFVAEDRGALVSPDASPEARSAYAEYFSTARLRRLSRIRSGGPHPDLWQAHRLVLEALGGDGLDQLGIPPLGGVFDPDPRARTVADQPEPDLLFGAELSNHALLAAIRHLSWVEVKGGRTQPVDYRNLGAEELGSVYESLLELIPRVDLADLTFRLETTAGNDRKTTGSYYTPPALVSALLDTALDPLLDEAVGDGKDADGAEQRLLALTVCDPACGSGGFLVAAARRIARRLAQVRSGEDEPTPEVVQHALRDVVGRCIYGVDLNDLAAELAKVSLWLEALEPGKPLGFLDARIRVGNSLLGTTPALMAEGIPDGAFKEIEGDDKKYAAAIRKQNKAERAGQSSLFAVDNTIPTAALATERAAVLAAVDDVDATRAQARAWADYEHSDTYQRAKLQADAWCAAFVWPLAPGAIPPVTEDVFQRLSTNPEASALADQVAKVHELADGYRFFHWHLEFPEVFGDPGAAEVGSEGWPEGFSCLLGNPPWMRVEMLLERYFAHSAPAIASAKNDAQRRKLIAELETTDPRLHDQFLEDLRRISATQALLSRTDRYPFGSAGKLNTFGVFADLFRQLVDPYGRAGVIVPSGIVSGFTYRAFVQHLLSTRTLVAFLGMENEERIFPDVHNMTKFGLLTLSGVKAPTDRATFVAYARSADELTDPSRRYQLTSEEIEAINPNSLTVPAFRWAKDAHVAAAIHAAAPVLVRHEPPINPWKVDFLQMFNMATASSVFEDFNDVAPHVVDRRGAAAVMDDGRLVYPLYEGKMLWQYDHRYGTYDGQTRAQANKGVLPHAGDAQHDDPHFRVQPRYWVDEAEVESKGWWNGAEWGVAWRDVGAAERTFTAAVVPKVAAGDVAPLMKSALPPPDFAVLVAVLSSLVVDYDARQRGQRMNNFVVEQIAAIPPDRLHLPIVWLGRRPDDWLRERVLELAFTNVELEPFARACGDHGTPFRWLPERRAMIQAEIDAGVLHLYGLDREQTEWLIDSFTVLRKYEEAAVDRGGLGEFQTKRLVLEFYDTMAHAMQAGIPYKSPISPPPGDGPRHPQRST